MRDFGLAGSLTRTPAALLGMNPNLLGSVRPSTPTATLPRRGEGEDRPDSRAEKRSAFHLFSLTPQVGAAVEQARGEEDHAGSIGMATAGRRKTPRSSALREVDSDLILPSRPIDSSDGPTAASGYRARAARPAGRGRAPTKPEHASTYRRRRDRERRKSR